MTQCLICRADITEPVKQFGKPDAPICQSCYLDDLSWVQDDAEIVNELRHGVRFDEAIQAAHDRQNAEMEKAFFDDWFFVDIKT